MRLQLRQAVSTDAETIFSSYGQDPEVSRYLTWRPVTSVDQTRSFLVERERLWLEGKSFAWAITLTSSDRLVGMIEARITEEGVELGYVV
ncbi:MAG: GNAT family N-acetyltransferase, partial [Acidimicrobiia bacterium]|nr:GNAT family N-acetyltransferase [Acidimicrobiia bacterium]